jgi:DNA-binding Xre family transcriptional regulator
MAWKSKVRQLLLEKSAAENRRIDQRELAAAVNVEENTVSKWMSDEPMRQVRASTVSAFCEYFGVDFWDVVELAPDEEQRKSLSHQMTTDFSAAPVMG